MWRCMARQMLLCGTLALYILVCRPHARNTWAGLSPRAALAGMRPYLALAIPGLCMVALEWWCFEIIGFLAGGLGT